MTDKKGTPEEKKQMESAQDELISVLKKVLKHLIEKVEASAPESQRDYYLNQHIEEAKKLLKKK